MATKVGINGFGRIGRGLLRLLEAKEDTPLDIVAINDLVGVDNLAYLFKYDTMHGRFDGDVKIENDNLVVNGNEIEVTAEKDPANLAWDDKGVDIVVESSGVFRYREQIEKHLDAGAEKVILTVPAKDEIDSTIVLGVNDDDLSADDEIVSNASCTTNCFAPVAKVLNDEFGIKKGLMTTVHSYTATQAILDAPSGKTRRGRTAAENIIPTTTGAAIATTKVLPELKGKVDGKAIRVPTADGSCVDAVFTLDVDETSVEEVNNAMKEKAEGELEGILGYTEDPIVSSDVLDQTESSIFDAQATQLVDKNMIKVISWYDNEFGYTSRVIDLAERMIDMM